MNIPLTSIRPLVMTHMTLVKEPTMENLFAAFNAASDAWPTYSDRLLRYIDNEFGKAKEEIQGSEEYSILLFTGIKASVSEEIRTRLSLRFIESLIIESGLDAGAFADLVTSNPEMRVAMQKFAADCLSIYSIEGKM